MGSRFSPGSSVRARIPTHVASTISDCVADDAVRIEVVFHFRSVHPDAQIPLERANRNTIGGFTTSLRDLGISQPCCDKSDDENGQAQRLFSVEAILQFA